MYYVERGNKYKNVNKLYNGYMYMSKAEAEYAFELDCRVKAKEIIKWDRQVKLDLRANDIHICNYYVDFKAWLADGGIELIEVKGFETAVWKLKVKIMEATYLKEHPEMIYKVINVKRKMRWR